MTNETKPLRLILLFFSLSFFFLLTEGNSQ